MVGAPIGSLSNNNSSPKIKRYVWFIITLASLVSIGFLIGPMFASATHADLTTVSAAGYNPFSVSGEYHSTSVLINCLKITWDDGGSTFVFDPDLVPVIDPDNPPGSEGTWGPKSHTYSAPGTYLITVNAGSIEPDSLECIVLAGNTAGTVSVTVFEDTASVTSVSNDNPRWGIQSTTASGTLTSDGNGVAPDCVVVDWGDGSDTDDGGTVTYVSTSGTGTWGPSTSHTYDVPGTYVLKAYWGQLLSDGGVSDTCEVISSSAGTKTVSTRPHLTHLTLNDLTTVVGLTGYKASGVLTDTSAEEFLTGKVITFSGNGATSTLTDHVTMTLPLTISSPGELSIDSCAISAVSGCALDPVGNDPDLASNKVLIAGPGTEISFQPGTNFVRLIVQDMGTSKFKYIVTEGNAQRALIPPVDQPEREAYDSDVGELFGDLQIVAGRTDVAGESISNGILKVRITSVDDSTSEGIVGISAILTRDSDVHPDLQDDEVINFEGGLFELGTQPNPMIIDEGSYRSTGFSQEDEQDNLEITAHYTGDGDYYLSSDSEPKFYNVAPIVAGTGGEGGQNADTTGLGGSILSIDCNTLDLTSDSDKDGLCDLWEKDSANNGGGKKIEVGTAVGANGYDLFAQGARIGPQDLFLEIDCMNGPAGSNINYCPTVADLSALTQAYSRKGVTLHIQGFDGVAFSGRDIHDYRNPFHVWDDGATPDPVPDPKNDFAGSKNLNFGTSTERNFGGVARTLTTSDYLKAKAQAFHYMDFVGNINTGVNTACGVSGRAELYGNDAVVALGCGFTGSTGSSDERQGTMMHELGHNLGLKHGGGDDTNCKVNQISVMTYTRQMHWDKLPVPAAGTTTDYGWLLDYSRAPLASLDERKLDGVPNVVGNDVGLSDGNVLPSPTVWNALNPPSITSFRLIWGDPTSIYKIKLGKTGASIDWNEDRVTQTGATQDINKLNNVVGCSPLVASYGFLTSYDEWTIAKNNMNFRRAAGSTQDGFQDFQDPDFNQEMRGLERDALNKAATNPYRGLLQPINKFGVGNINTISVFTAGQIVPLKFQLIDGDGNIIKDADVRFGSLVKIDRPQGITKEELIKTTGETVPSINDQFAFKSKVNYYAYNMNTKGLEKGFYGIYIVINKGSTDPTKPEEILHQDGQLYSGVFEIVTKTK